MKAKKTINIEIGQNIKYYREAAGLTQEAFAEMLGLGVKHISAIECGAVGASITTLKQTSIILSVPVDYLFFGQNIEQPDAEIQLLQTRLSRLPKKKFKIVKEIIDKLLEAFNIDED